MIRRLQRRRGAALVETAFVFPVLIVLMIGLIVGALGVFRYQEVASLAREGSRYASLHGATQLLHDWKLLRRFHVKFEISAHLDALRCRTDLDQPSLVFLTLCQK